MSSTKKKYTQTTLSWIHIVLGFDEIIISPVTKAKHIAKHILPSLWGGDARLQLSALLYCPVLPQQ